MGKDQSPKGGTASTHAPPAPASPGKQTQGAGQDAGADVDAQTVRLPGVPIGIRLPAPQRKPIDLRVKAPEEISPAVDEFRRALEGQDKAAAEHAWMLMSTEDKRAFGQASTIDADLFRVLKVMGPMTVHVMGESGLDFTGRGDLIEKILQVGFPHWFDGLQLYGGAILQSFLDHLPSREQLDPAALKKLDRIMKWTNAVAIAKPLFERIYVPLADTTYNAKRVRTTPWKAEHIKRLYDVLSANLPVAHVRTIKAFHLSTEEFEDGEWKTAKGAWWNRKGGYVVLPEHSAKQKAGESRNHRMTGGKLAHADPKTKKGRTEGTIDKFEVGALHEVGHAVGDSLGGHMFARSHPFVDWKTNMDPATWSKGLWGDDAALTARAAKKGFDQNRAISAVDARTYMAQSLNGSAKPPKGWHKDEFEEAVAELYGDQSLAKYWERRRSGEDRSTLYQFSGTANYSADGRVYVYCSRGGNQLSSYDQNAHQQKVSWYSLSSPHEWWAEQYAHYYGHGKTGAGLDAGTLAKLREMDKRDPEKENALLPPEDLDAPANADHDDDSETKTPLPFRW